jgi:hypothetical protein
LPFFTAFHITTDLTANTITFQPGCGCANSPDAYPKVLVDNILISGTSSNSPAITDLAKETETTSTLVPRETVKSSVVSAKPGINVIVFLSIFVLYHQL